MSRVARVLVVALLSLLLVPAFSCSSSSSFSPPTGEPQLEITDQLGRVVALYNVPQRIVSLDPANTEILFALGLGDRVVGVTEGCDYPDEATTKDTIGSYASPDTELVKKLSPDLVVAGAIHEPEIIPVLESAGITVLGLDPESLDDIMAAITLVGEATQSQSEASALVTGLEARVKAVTDQTDLIPSVERPRILYAIWHDPLYTAGPGTLEDDIIQKAGGINIARDFLTDYREWNWETAVAVDPEVILVAINFSLGVGYDAAYQSITSDAVIMSTQAGRSDQVYVIWDAMIGRPGPRAVNGLEEVAMLLQLLPAMSSAD